MDKKQLKQSLLQLSPLTELIGTNASKSKRVSKEEAKISTCFTSSTCVLLDSMTDKLNAVFGAVEDMLSKSANKAIPGRYWSRKTMLLTVPPWMQLNFYSASLFTACNLEMGNPFKAFFLVKEDQQQDTFIVHFQVSLALPNAMIRQLAGRVIDALLPDGASAESTPGVKVRHIHSCFRDSGKNASTQISPYVMRERAGFVKENIYLIWTHHTEGDVPESIYSQQVDLICLIEQLQRLYNQNMVRVCLSPTSYDTILQKLSMMNPKQLREVFRENDLDQLYQQLQSLIFDKAVYELCNQKCLDVKSEYPQQEQSAESLVQQATIKKLMISTEHIRNHVQESSHITNYKLFLRCVLGPTQNKLEHPSFFAHIRKNTAVLLEEGVTDAAIYNSEFIVPLVLVARYIARICMQDMDSLSSNGATLLMCGAAGAGKSIIANSIARFANGYKWNSDTLYQTPSLMSASVIVIEEAKLAQMGEPLYKQLLDITAYAKVEIKNAHPVDATLHCPVILNTNEQVLEYFNGSSCASGGRQGGATLNRSRRYFTNEQLAAVHRRVSIVPFTQKFSKLHRVPATFLECPLVQELYDKFSDSPGSEARLFNFFLIFGIYQSYLTRFEVNVHLVPLLEKLAVDFNKTIFGKIYLSHRQTIDRSFRDLETLLNADMPDENEILRLTYKLSEYLGTLVETTFGVLISHCLEGTEPKNGMPWNNEESGNLFAYWNRPDWCEMTSFIKRLVVTANPGIKHQLARGAVDTGFGGRWKNLLFNKPAYIDDDEEEIEDERDLEFE